MAVSTPSATEARVNPPRFSSLSPVFWSLIHLTSSSRGRMRIGPGWEKVVIMLDPVKLSSISIIPILILPLEEDVKCIKLQNTGDKEENLGGFTLASVAEGVETAYKFHRTVKVAPGDEVTVWSSDADA